MFNAILDNANSLMKSSQTQAMVLLVFTSCVFMRVEIVFSNLQSTLTVHRVTLLMSNECITHSLIFIYEKYIP